MKRSFYYFISLFFILLLVLFIDKIHLYIEYINNTDINTLNGLIIDKNNNLVTLMNDNDAMILLNEKINYNIGDYITITYVGDIDYLNENDIDIKMISKKENPLNNRIMKYVNNLSVDQKIGQLIFAIIPKDNKKESIQKYHIGGYIYFANDIGKRKTIEDIQNEIKQYQKASDIPLLIGIDEEGGTVSRLNQNDNITPSNFNSPKLLYNTGGFDLILEDARRKKDTLVNLGFNINLAPVIDVVTDPNAFMYQRSLGLDQYKTAEFAKLILSTQTKDLTYTFKHFPGYANNIDTHEYKSIDNRKLEEFYKVDFIPYKEAIKNGAKLIMVSHNIVEDVDNKPSSLSLKMHNILREDLNFKGVIITDSLSMKAISNYETHPYADAILAGNNLLITENVSKTFKEIRDYINNGKITKVLLDRLVYRVIELKIDKGMIK